MGNFHKYPHNLTKYFEYPKTNLKYQKYPYMIVIIKIRVHLCHLYQYYCIIPDLLIKASLGIPLA